MRIDEWLIRRAAERLEREHHCAFQGEILALPDHLGEVGSIDRLERCGVAAQRVWVDQASSDIPLVGCDCVPERGRDLDAPIAGRDGREPCKAMGGVADIDRVRAGQCSEIGASGCLRVSVHEKGVAETVEDHDGVALVAAPRRELEGTTDQLDRAS